MAALISDLRYSIRQLASMPRLLESTGCWRTPLRNRDFEIGIRLAIGATPGLVLRQLVSGGLRIASTGIAGGLVLWFIASRFVGNLLYGVTAFDAKAYGITVATKLALAAIAYTVPTRHASQRIPTRSSNANNRLHDERIKVSTYRVLSVPAYYEAAKHCR